MAITFRGATGLTANTVTAVTWTLPGNVAQNDLLLACYSGKPFNATFGASSPPQTYTALGSAVNGAVSNGVGVGSNHTIAYWKVHGASEGATMTGTLGVTPSPSMAAHVGFRSTRGGTAWSVETTVGTDVVTTGTTFSALGSAALAFYPGKTLVVIVGTPDDVSAPTSWAVSATGITFGTASQVLGTAVTGTGNDGSLQVVHFPVTAGIGTVTPTFTMTTSSGDSNGAATFVLLTEPQIVTGVVAGTANTSGTVIAPDKGALGVVAGTATTSGTTVGDKDAFGLVFGTTSTSGTVVGTKAEGGGNINGSVTGSSSTSGTIAGSKGAGATVTGTSTTSGTITGAEGSPGVVTGTSSTSGTVAGRKGAAGAVSGAAGTSGTITGSKAATGLVAGSSGTSGTILGTADEPNKSGSVSGTSTTSGTIVGTAYDPDAPVVVPPTGGMSAYRRAQITAAQLQALQDAERAANAKSGAVHGASTTTGRITGRAGRSGRTMPTPAITYRSHTTGAKSITARVAGHQETRGCVAGDAIYPMSSRQVRQWRDDAELLLII